MRFTNAISAELVRSRHTASARLPLLGVAICLIQGVAGFGATQRFTDWQQLLYWQGIYVTGLLVPLSALLIGLAVAREQRAREGGTGWRPLSPRTVLVARFVVLAGQLLGFNLAIMLPTLGFGWVRGWFPGPVGRLTGLALALWASSLGAAALAYAVARRWGLFAALGVALGWQIAGTICAESPTWWVQPWTWSVRPALPLLGIHANATPLDPGSHLGQISPWPAVGLSVLLAVLVLVALAYAPRLPALPRRASATPAATAATASRPTTVRRVRPAPVLAFAGALRRTAIAPLVIATVALLGLVAAVWNASYVRGLFGYAILPLGCSLLACLVWQTHQGSWRILRTRAGVRDLCVSIMITCVGALTVVVVVAVALVTIRGGRFPVAYAAVGWFLGVGLVAVNLWLATRFGTAAALGASLVGWVLSLIFGGTLSDTPLWVVGVLAWPMSAEAPHRVLIAIVGSLLLAATGFAGWLEAAAHRRP